MKQLLLSLLMLTCGSGAAQAAEPQRWPAEQANAWYAQQPWPLGSDYIPYNAINELEMWQADTFDPRRIDLELGWAQKLGMNTMRVFLHDLLWQQDPEGFNKRLQMFLDIASIHGIWAVFVLFVSCWVTRPRLGPQLRIARRILQLSRTGALDPTRIVHTRDGRMLWTEPRPCVPT